ncbi:hypothetical protein [Natronomonas sp. LN261]|uniref:helix-turn-helix transcriptional regulator n=1 Tax=Natronomonas sp. LN261 TaxID=2750669 RepID=UPI0015EF0AB5|nr:hypothetical protein [Natronomonas sp. LN261]
MSYEPMQISTLWRDRLPCVSNLARGPALLIVVVVALIGIHGIIHILFALSGHLQPSLHDIGIILWGLTTLVAVGGLLVFGRAYTSIASQIHTEPQIHLEILPEDEQQVLQPVLETPGITQVEVVGRSDFSDAKVSQTLKALRNRGLIYREPQGRTYRLYPGTLLEEATSVPEVA